MTDPPAQTTSPLTRVCPHCGTVAETETSSDRCPHCGRRYGRRAPIVWVTFGIVVFLLLIAGCTWLASETLRGALAS